MSRELVEWLAGSARFRTFAEAHRDKIRKKVRGAADPDSLRDVRAELRTARLLLADRRIELAFEAYGSGKRGPDFTITFRGARSFNLEVTRLRRVPDATGLGRITAGQASPAAAERARTRCCSRPTPTAQARWTSTRRPGCSVSRADAKDERFFSTRGFDGTRGFYERYLRLSAVFVSAEGADGDARATIWVNRSARIAMPEPAARACLRCLRVDLEAAPHLHSEP